MPIHPCCRQWAAFCPVLPISHHRLRPLLYLLLVLTYTYSGIHLGWVEPTLPVIACWWFVGRQYVEVPAPASLHFLALQLKPSLPVLRALERPLFTYPFFWFEFRWRDGDARDMSLIGRGVHRHLVHFLDQKLLNLLPSPGIPTLWHTSIAVQSSNVNHSCPFIDVVNLVFTDLCFTLFVFTLGYGHVRALRMKMDKLNVHYNTGDTKAAVHGCRRFLYFFYIPFD